MRDYFLADDLSGALDAAAAFHHVGRRVTVAISQPAWADEGADVIGITTETRNQDGAIAAAVVKRTLEEMRGRGARLLYKKIDSTLRGPVAAEVAALARAMPEAQILFAPANPAVGRTVRRGQLLVRGIPVAETEFARDPASPVTTSDIRALLGDIAPGRIVIPDAETAADLGAAVQAMNAAGDPWVAVGSGALVRWVAQYAAGPAAAKDGSLNKTSEISILTSCIDPPPAGGKPLTGATCMVVCGSAHPLNPSQAVLLTRERGVTCHVLPSDDIAATLIAAGSDKQDSGVALLLDERRGDSAELLASLVSVAAERLARTGCARVFVTGGETAFALCGRLGIDRLVYQREVEPGLSVSAAPYREGTLFLAVKPGGFGDERTWVRAWDALQKASA